MAEPLTPLQTIFAGWDVYQARLGPVIAPLSAEQLALRAAPNLRSIGDIVNHIIGARARWMHNVLALGGDEIAAYARWDREPARRTGAELAGALEATWRVLDDALKHWSPADLQELVEGKRHGETETFSRQWVIWHLLEHDLHHGGELGFSLGMHDLPAPEL
jgi:uncharacterized damage-inducible protein DinB